MATTTLEQQVRSIRVAIKGLEYERSSLLLSGERPDTKTVTDISDEIAALNDAIATLRSAHALRQSLKSFIEG